MIGRTRLVLRKPPSWTHRHRRTLRTRTSNRTSGMHRRTAIQNLQAMFPHTILPTEERRHNAAIAGPRPKLSPGDNNLNMKGGDADTP